MSVETFEEMLRLLIIAVLSSATGCIVGLVVGLTVLGVNDLINHIRSNR